MHPETKFKIQLFQKLRKRKLKNVYVRKLVAGSVRGIPDILIIVKGMVLMPELKMPGKKPTNLQKLNIEQINRAGGFSFALYPKQLKEFLDCLEELSLEV